MNSKSVMNITEVNNTIERMIMLCEEEENNLKKIREKLNNLEDCYKGSKSKKIASSNIELCNNFNTIIDNRKRYIRTLKSNVEIYINSSNETSSLFRNMGEI